MHSKQNQGVETPARKKFRFRKTAAGAVLVGGAAAALIAGPITPASAAGAEVWTQLVAGQVHAHLQLEQFKNACTMKSGVVIGSGVNDPNAQYSLVWLVCSAP